MINKGTFSSIQRLLNVNDTQKILNKNERAI